MPGGGGAGEAERGVAVEAELRSTINHSRLNNQERSVGCWGFDRSRMFFCRCSHVLRSRTRHVTTLPTTLSAAPIPGTDNIFPGEKVCGR
jgi:hypothetical protein